MNKDNYNNGAKESDGLDGNSEQDGLVNSFEKIREELKQWPYTIHQIHDTLDLSLIEGRGKQILFQSLNTKNITAFIGSGVSASYGRMSWSDWQNAQLKTTRNLTDTLLDLIEASITRSNFVTNYLSSIDKQDGERIAIEKEIRTTIRWINHHLQHMKFAKQEILKLKLSFDLAQDKSGAFPEGDGLPIKFEIAQMLHDLVLRNRDLFLPDSPISEADSTALKIWGIRADAASGAPIDSLNTILGIENSELNESNDTFRDLQFKLEKYKNIAERPEGKMSFEALSKVLLVDECAHAEQLLISGLGGGYLEGRGKPYTKANISELRNDLDVLSMENCKRDISGIRQNPSRFTVLQSFRIKKFQELASDPNILRVLGLNKAEERSKHWKTLFTIISERFKDYDDERIFLTPTSRFLVKMILKLSRDPKLIHDRIEENMPLSGKDYQSRRSIIANRFDPLDRTVRRLNIHRYLTTNYDFELERYYQDVGYRNSELSDLELSSSEISPVSKSYDRGDYRADGLGSTLWDATFNPNKSSDLVSFATVYDGADSAVFHLHGRATEEDKLVITERNYMDMYVRSNDERDMIDEGISIAFSATPILFLGLGMTEADVLKPLRQFISDNDRSRGYTAMVLLPADNSIEARSKFASSVFLRYGVHTIFYGSGELTFRGENDKKKTVAIDWLHRITQLVKSVLAHTENELEELDKVLKSKTELSAINSIDDLHESEIEKRIRKLNIINEVEELVGYEERKRLGELRITLEDVGFEPKGSIELLDDIDKAVGDMKDDLQRGDVSAKSRALPFLFGLETIEILKDRVEDNEQLPELLYPYFTTEKPGSTSTARSKRFINDFVGTDGKEYLEFYLDLLTPIINIALCSPSKKLKLSVYRRELTAQKSALEGVKAGLLTASLCAALTGLEKEWRVWWQHWQQRPPHRKPSIETQHSEPPDEAIADTNPVPRRFIRYRVINSISDMSNAEKTHNKASDVDQRLPDEITHIRSFDTFIEAVAAKTTALDKQVCGPASDGRRFYTVAADTGLGKGTFFSMFATRLGFTNYLRAAHPQWDFEYQGKERTTVMAGIFLNFSFSTEIASTFDMSLSLVKGLLCWLYGIEKLLSEQPSSKSSVELDRIIDLSKLKVTERDEEENRLESEKLESILSKKDTWIKTFPKLLICDKRDLPDDDDYNLLQDAIRKRSTLAMERLHKQFRGIGRSEFLRDVSIKYGQISKLFSSNYLRHYAECTRDIDRVSVKKLKPRLVICLNGCELFFDSKKQAKNREIADFLDFLASPDMSRIPFDIIAIGSESRLGAPWNQHYQSKHNVDDIRREKMGDDTTRFYNDKNYGMGRKKSNRGLLSLSQIKRGAIPKNYSNDIYNIDTDLDAQRPNSRDSNGIVNYLMTRRECDSRAIHHIKKRASISSIHINHLESYEPRASTHSYDQIESTNTINFVYFARILDPRRLLVDNFLPLAALLYLHSYKKKYLHRYNKSDQNEAKNWHWNDFRKLYKESQENQESAWSTLEIADIENRTRDIKTDYEDGIYKIVRAIDGSNIGPMPDGTKHTTVETLREGLIATHRRTNDASVLKWNVIRQTLSSNRYCLTMLLAAAQEIALSEETWDVGADKAIGFIQNTVNGVRNVSRSITEETVLQAVLDVYRRYHKIGKPDYDIELHHHLLRNIAAINSPTASNVIVRLPSVREYINSIKDSDTLGLGRRRMVVKALEVLGDRGLVFRLAPHSSYIDYINPPSQSRDGEPSGYQNEANKLSGTAGVRASEDKEWPVKYEFRYSLHRLVQQYCATKLGSTALEPVRVNAFAPSLYASMPSGIPRLSHEAYRYLRALLVGLSQYPDIPHENRHDPVWLYSSQDPRTSIQSLRSAMTLVRSTFSIAVVSRFEEYKSIANEDHKRRRGYFETYKVRLRWIIRKAWELHIPEYDKSDDQIVIGSNSNPTHDGFDNISALYRDEIVWLYNEVGLVCLVQGNLRESVTHLRQAMALNTKIEGDSGGRQHSLLSINLAIVQMERGRLSKSIERLKNIIIRENGVRGKMYFLAQGYLGLLMHLTGRKKESKKLLSQAAEYFEDQGEDRATAIFRNHLARLISDGDHEQALIELKTASEHAERGGHEDIRHHILISTVRISQLFQPESHQRLVRDRLILQDVEEYARVMGVPSLMCDALHTKSLMLLENGDSTSSGKVMIRAMAIARKNDMQIRLNSMMTAYARILLHRGNVASSRRLLISSLEIAKKYEFSLQIDRAQRVLENEDFSLNQF